MKDEQEWVLPEAPDRGGRAVTAREVYVLPLAAAVAGTILGFGVALYAVDTVVRVARWAVRR